MVAPAAVGHTGGDDAIGQGFAGGNAQASVVDEGSLAPFRRIKLVKDGIVDEAADDLALALQSDGDRKERNAVQEIGGTVEWVDDPAVRPVRTRNQAALLHQEAV